MNQIIAKEPPSVIADMATRYGMDKRAFEATIRATCMPSKVVVTNEQFAAFLLVAREYNLNPLTREIFAFPAKSGGVQTVVSIDGWCNLINSRAELDGIEFDDIKDDKGNLTAISCKIFRKDRSKPIPVIEYMKECKGSSEPWQRWPARMLRHKALIQCARYAFGFSGIVDPDEAERMDMVDVTPPARSVFKNAALRNTWWQNALDSIKEAKTEDDLVFILERLQPKINEMHDNANEHDLLAIDSIEQAAGIARKNFDSSSMTYEQTQEDIAASFGQGFADTQVNEPQEEEPVKLSLSGWQREINSMPSADGVEFKYKQAIEQFKTDTVALNALSITRDKRLLAIKQEAA